MQRLCVYCGSSAGQRPEYRQAAESLGTVLAGRGIGLVYGGAGVGLMGVVADAALAAGGEVIGILPRTLMHKEIAHAGLTRLHIVDSMHQRKAMMAELSDGFIALPGGLGTLEELFEILTWAILGLHQKPCGLLDVADYYGGLVGFLDRAAEDGFVRQAHRRVLLVGRSPDELLAKFQEFQPLETPKWIELKDT